MKEVLLHQAMGHKKKPAFGFKRIGEMSKNRTISEPSGIFQKTMGNQIYRK